MHITDCEISLNKVKACESNLVKECQYCKPCICNAFLRNKHARVIQSLIGYLTGGFKNSQSNFNQYLKLIQNKITFMR